MAKEFKLSYTGAEIDRKLGEIDNKADRTEISSPYNFKGSTTTSALPTSGNVVNDTYYCTDVKCKYTWNGAGWYQSSLNESEYEEELSKRVSIETQTLTEEQKAQARENIGAATKEEILAAIPQYKGSVVVS